MQKNNCDSTSQRRKVLVRSLDQFTRASHNRRSETRKEVAGTGQGPVQSTMLVVRESISVHVPWTCGAQLQHSNLLGCPRKSCCQYYDFSSTGHCLIHTYARRFLQQRSMHLVPCFGMPLLRIVLIPRGMQACCRSDGTRLHWAKVPEGAGYIHSTRTLVGTLDSGTGLVRVCEKWRWTNRVLRT